MYLNNTKTRINVILCVHVATCSIDSYGSLRKVRCPKIPLQKRFPNGSYIQHQLRYAPCLPAAFTLHDARLYVLRFVNRQQNRDALQAHYGAMDLPQELVHQNSVLSDDLNRYTWDGY